MNAWRHRREQPRRQGLASLSAVPHAGCQFTNLGGSRNVLYVNTASVRIVNSTFSNNIIPGEQSAIIYTNGATWLEGTAFVYNSAARLLIGGSSVNSGVASDVPREILLDYEILDTTEFPDDVSAFLNGDESCFQDVLAVCRCPCRPLGIHSSTPCCPLPACHQQSPDDVHAPAFKPAGLQTCEPAVANSRKNLRLQLVHVPAGIPQRQHQQ